MSDNRVDATLSQADLTAITAALDTIRQKLPFLIDLTPDERRDLPKMGDKTRAFVSAAATLVAQDDSFLPRGFDIPAFQKDVALLAALQPVRAALIQLTEQVDDTVMRTGSEAYVDALSVYQSARQYGKGQGLDTLLDELGRRFARRASSATNNDPKPTP